MFTLDQVVPWGRSFDEYRRMFALSENDLRSSILGCADGPASFNAEALSAGYRVVSCDPLYRCNTDQIRERVRVAHEVRVFPLLALGGERSPYMDALQKRLGAEGYATRIEKVHYEFQRGGNQMMRVSGPSSKAPSRTE